VPPGTEVVEIVTPAITVIDKGCAGEVFPPLSFTVTLNDEVAADEGVPLITPLEAFRDSPPGNVPELTVQLL